MFKGVKFYESMLATVGAGLATGAITGLGVGYAGHRQAFRQSYPSFAKEAEIAEAEYLAKEKYRNRVEQLKKIKFQYELKMDDCEVPKCFEQFSDKINELNEEIYDLEAKILEPMPSNYIGEGVVSGALIGGLAGAGLGYLGGTISGDSEAERIAYLKLETTKRIKEIKNEIESSELDLREQIKFYRDSLKQCEDTRCIDDIRNKIQIIQNEMRENSDRLNKEIFDLKRAYQNEVDYLRNEGLM